MAETLTSTHRPISLRECTFVGPMETPLTKMDFRGAVIFPKNILINIIKSII